MEPVIYKIENKINGKCYIGKSINVKQRWQSHLRNALKTERKGPLLNALRKYGSHNFSFDIIKHSTMKTIDVDEIEMIREYDSVKNGYNLTLGGEGGDTFTNLTSEAKEIRRKQISMSSKRANAKNRELHSKNTKALWQDPEYVKKVKDGLSKARTPEYYQRHSEIMKEVCNTPKARAMRSKNASGKNNSNYKGIIYLYHNDTLIREYDFIKDVIADTGLNMLDISRSIKNDTVINRQRSNKQYNGYQFTRIKK
jgi:group I intron endonuclease